MDSEDPETYLRLLAESELRRARAGAPDATAEPGRRVRDVAAAFAWTRALDRELALTIVDGLDTALDARFPGRTDAPPRPAGPAALSRRHRGSMLARAMPPGVSRRDIGPVTATPGGQVVVSGGQTDVHVLAVIRTPARTWLSVAAHILDGGPPRRPVPGIAPRPPRGAAQAGFPPHLRATDAAGTSYHLGLSGGGGGEWFHGQSELSPNPPEGTTWVDVDGGGQPVRIDLTARPPRAQVAVTPVVLSPGEAYLQAQADSLLASRRPAISADLARLAAVVPALTAVGVLPAESVTAGRLRWLCERFGVTGHGLTSPPAEPLERWTGLLAYQDARSERPDAYFTGNGDRHQGGPRVAVADLVATLPETDGLAISLAGLIVHGDRTILSGVYHRTGDRDFDPDDWPVCWLRDDTGQWHGTWQSSSGGELYGLHWFRLDLLPPLRPPASPVEVVMRGRATETRATVPLTWRTYG